MEEDANRLQNFFIIAFLRRSFAALCLVLMGYYIMGGVVVVVGDEDSQLLLRSSATNSSLFAVNASWWMVIFGYMMVVSFVMFPLLLFLGNKTISVTFLLIESFVVFFWCIVGIDTILSVCPVAFYYRAFFICSIFYGLFSATVWNTKEMSACYEYLSPKK